MPTITRLLSTLLFFIVLCCHSDADTQIAPTKDSWQDRFPHKSGFVQANGVRLHFLDWGGRGKTLLFLADIGYSAHIFDSIAPQFTDHFHVLGLTRRGHGQSDKPSSGYDNDTLLEDIRQFLDKKGISRVILVGHGLAGTEMTHLAGVDRDRVEKLVYLDAAYDSEDTNPVMAHYDAALRAVPPPAFPGRDTPALDSARAWAKQRLGCWSDAMEAELHVAIVRHADGKIEDALPDRAAAALQRDVTLSASELAKLRVPMLSFYAMDSVGSVFPWLPADAPQAKRKAAQSFVDFGNQQKREQIARFRRGGVNRQVVELPDTVHLCFISRQVEIVQKMRSFLSER